MSLFPLFQREKEAWLERARKEARKQLRRKPTITIEDVLKKCPRPEYIHRNTTGSVFQDVAFVATGWRPSKRPLMNGRQVRVWALNPKYVK